MSRVRLLLIALGMTVALPAPGASAQTSPLAGTWQSAADELPLNAPHQEAIWGRNAKEIRTVRMVVRPNNDATLTVTRRVMDARGRAVKGTTSVEQVDVTLGSAADAGGIRVDLPVTVKAAERRYPDDPEGNWAIEGLRVTATTFPDDPLRLEVRLDFPDGRGSFWEELRRVGPRARASVPAAGTASD
jgi:hypothetical protein